MGVTSHTWAGVCVEGVKSSKACLKEELLETERLESK